MPMKDILHKLQPIQLYVVLVLTIILFLWQLYLSQITHALTLLVASYHMLCNIIALSGCLITIKHSKKKAKKNKEQPLTEENVSYDGGKFVEVCIAKQKTELQKEHENTLKNTFGWTRIDVLTMLIVCIFMASLCFSLLVEAIQTLVHIKTKDAMHQPILVLITGGLALVLNGMCYLLIGGYTFHQGSFLHITSSGDVILDRVVSGDSLKHGERRLSRTKKSNVSNFTGQRQQRQSIIEMTRDICSTIFVIICSIIVYLVDDDDITKFVDPIISIVSCMLLLCLSYPYMKESGLILLQTIPNTIDIELFKTTLLTQFTDIVSVHDLHIWQLTASKYVSTVHIIFQNPIVYTSIVQDVKKFFHEQGIQIVTIQPEFNSTKPVIETSVKSVPDCLVPCQDYACMEKHCCVHNINDLKAIKINDKLDSKPTTCCDHDNTNKKDNEIIISAIEFCKDKPQTEEPHHHHHHHNHHHHHHHQHNPHHHTNEDLQVDVNISQSPANESEHELGDDKLSIKSIKSVVSLSALSKLKETINDDKNTNLKNEREFVSDTELNQHENINNVNLDKEKSPEIQDLHNLDSNKNLSENNNIDTETYL